jgi:NADH:ubiquinone oxidoreductase subunit 3 (subunit A)
MIGDPMQILFTPPLAFLIYMVLVGLLTLLGKRLAATSGRTTFKTSTYSSGEEAPTRMAAPGYRPFFVVALFFAVLHLGVLVMSTGGASPVMIVYLFGLLLALLALILG